MKDVWKKYDETELTHSSVHHLVAINTLLKENGYARSVDIANHLNISRASVSITINKLKDKGFIAEDKNKFLQLSKKGSSIVNSVLSKRKIIDLFFTKVLALSPDESEINACKTEHLISEHAGRKLISLLGFFLSDQKEAVNFRKKFKKFNYICTAINDCEICELDCYFNNNKR
jgi:DtxR family Mn-dependent transcriptional regulator